MAVKLLRRLPDEGSPLSARVREGEGLGVRAFAAPPMQTLTRRLDRRPACGRVERLLY